MTLSDKIWDDNSVGIEDVKEFIKELKKELKENCLVYPQIINKLAGEKLI